MFLRYGNCVRSSLGLALDIGERMMCKFCLVLASDDGGQFLFGAIVMSGGFLCSSGQGA